MTEYKVAIGPALETKIPAGDPYWREFNASFHNLSLEAIDIAAALYEGCPITAWHKNNWRRGDNYLLGQHIGLDFDTEDKRSTIMQLQREPLTAKYGSIVYTTPSHTPDSPRARVIFLLDTPIQQATNYALASNALLWVFGNADRQCKDPARFFYGGKPGACEMEYLDNELPLDVIKDMIQRYQSTGNRERRRVNTQYQAGNAEEAEVLDALKHVDPWSIAYDDWLAVLLAIHSEFPGPNGLHMAESWASGRPGEVAQKWRGFHPSGNVSGRVGIGTLFKFAQERGWQHDKQRAV